MVLKKQVASPRSNASSSSTVTRNDELRKFSEDGDTQSVSFLVFENKCNPDLPDEVVDSSYPLVMELNHDPKIKQFGTTPLMLAVSKNHFDTVETLLAAGAKLDSQNHVKITQT